MIIVTGMHRSGTSMVAGVLYHLGVYMGDDLMIDDIDQGQTKEQPCGYYEDREFMRINDTILQKSKGAWNRVPDRDLLLDRCWEANNTLDILLERRTRNHKVWGFKDPRTCLTLPAYLTRWHMVTGNQQIIVISRNQKDVVKSLVTREQISKHYANYLYRAYHEYLNLSLQRTYCLQVTFEHLVETKYIGHIVDFLRLTPTDDQYKMAISHIKPGVRAGK